MSDKLNELTAEQSAQMPAFVDKWAKIALSTAPVDRAVAERAIQDMYARANLARPTVIWSPCPISAGLAAICYSAALKHSPGAFDVATFIAKALAKLVQLSSGDGPAVCARVLQSVIDAVAQAPRQEQSERVRALLADSECAVGTNALRPYFTSHFDHQVTNGTEYAVERLLGNIPDLTEDVMYSVLLAIDKDDVEHRVRHSYFGGGLWNAAYCAWVDFLSNILAVDVAPDFRNINIHCGYFWTLDGVVFVSEHPTKIDATSATYGTGWTVSEAKEAAA